VPIVAHLAETVKEAKSTPACGAEALDSGLAGPSKPLTEGATAEYYPARRGRVPDHARP